MPQSKGCWRKPAEMRRIAVRSLEPDPGNAGVGMREYGFCFRIATPPGPAMRYFFRKGERHMKINKTRMICEAAIFIAMAEILLRGLEKHA